MRPAATESPAPGKSLATAKVPGHWLLARLGKRVLRPGGLELTRRMLEALAVGPGDDVVEFAPGLGITARMTLARRPASYTAIERDEDAAAIVRGYLTGNSQRCLVGSAEATGLDDGSASVVYGEAMLTMQPPQTRSRIATEAARLLRPGGRYGIHEIVLTPDDTDENLRRRIEHGLSEAIHHSARPLTSPEWVDLLESAGLTVQHETRSPMHLLEPRRIIADEGFARAVRFAWNVMRDGEARRRVGEMRRMFRTYADHLAAIALVAVKRHSPG